MPSIEDTCIHQGRGLVRSTAAYALGLILLGATALSSWYTLRDVRELLESSPSVERNMTNTPDELRTSWVDAGGVTHEVVTRRRTGDTAATWAARHQEAVEALQVIYPPN